jgi:L-aspartate oxidase
MRDTERTIVVGSGLAGLTCALSLAPRPVTLISKTAHLEGGSSIWAQGGIAAAVGPGDSPQAHAEDTVSAGAGLCDPERVRTLTEDGALALGWLLDEGINFDREATGELQLAREGSHQHARVVHAGGDATGNVLMRELVRRVAESPSISVLTDTFVSDLLISKGQVAGVVACNQVSDWMNIPAPRVVLATGGIGMAWDRTTNPSESTGDGLAMAARAGAKLANIEFMQFHPTALAVEAGGSNLTLLTEALRGAGATLLDESGHRFMQDIHALAELAPRDVVARAIHARVSCGQKVFLDMAPALRSKGAEAFPGAVAAAKHAGVDPYVDSVPVVPAAHYHMGGIQVDSLGRSSLTGLWACGEVSATGIHGANRLASNSLLEAVVYARRVADDICSSVIALPDIPVQQQLPRPVMTNDAKIATIVTRIRRLMTRQVGIARSEDELRSALTQFESIKAELGDTPGEVQNLLLVAQLIALAALRRTESRGAHFRRDFPQVTRAWQHTQLMTVDALLESH